MIETTVEVRGARLNVSHDGETIHGVTSLNDQENILPLISAAAEQKIYNALEKKRALLYPRPLPLCDVAELFR
jgi:hypothetical protein